MLEVQVKSPAGGPDHRRYRVAVLLQLGLALGAVHVEDQDARDRPRHDADARPGPGAEFLLRGLAHEVRTQLAEVRLLRARLDRYGRPPPPPAVLDGISPGRGAHATPAQSPSAEGRAASTSRSSGGVDRYPCRNIKTES